MMKKKLILFAIMVLFAQYFSQLRAYADNSQNQNIQQDYKIISHKNNGEVSGWTINLPNGMEQYDSNGKLVGCTKNGVNKIINKNDNGEVLGWTVNLSNRIESYDNKGRFLGFTEKVGNKVTNYNCMGQAVDTTVYSGNKIIQTHYDNKGKIIDVTVNEIQ